MPKANEREKNKERRAGAEGGEQGHGVPPLGGRSLRAIIEIESSSDVEKERKGKGRKKARPHYKRAATLLITIQKRWAEIFGQKEGEGRGRTKRWIGRFKHGEGTKKGSGGQASL